VEAQPQANTPRARLARRFTVATAGDRHRRRLATVGAIAIAALLGYHAFFGANGVSAYSAKRQEDRLLATQLEQLRHENDRLQQHVEHLKSDPDAIEFEAHTRLRYTRGDQVIVLNDAPATEEVGGHLPNHVPNDVPNHVPNYAARDGAGQSHSTPAAEANR
jgi:cell division protein FtsB